MHLLPHLDITTWDFPNDPVAKILHSNAGGMGLISDQGIRPHTQQLSLWAATTEPTYISRYKDIITHRYHYTYIIRKDDRDWPYKSWQEDWGSKTLCTACANVKWHNYFWKSFGSFLTKLKMYFQWLNNPSPRYLPKRNKNVSIQALVHECAHSSFIHCSIHLSQN